MNTTAQTPKDWAYPQYRDRPRPLPATIPTPPTTAGDATAYDHAHEVEGEDERTPWYVQLTVWGTLALILGLAANCFLRGTP